MGFENYGLVKHEGDDSIDHTTGSLNGKTIGVLDSAIKNSLVDFLNKKNINAQIISYSDYDTLLDAFDKREMDVLAAENDGIYDRRHAEMLYTFGSSDYYLCVSKDRPDLLKELNSAQNQLFIENPEYLSDLRNKYFPITLASRAFTSSEKLWFAEHDRVIVGYLNNYLPYSDTEKDGKVTGMVKDLLPYLFKELGYENISIIYKGFDNYDDLVASMADDEIDIAFPVGGGLFFSEEDGMFISNPVISSLTDLIYSTEMLNNNDQIFAVNENNKLQYYYIMNHYNDAKVVYYKSIDDCLKAVLRGEATYTTLNGLRTSSILKKSDYEKLSFRQLGYADDRCFGVKIGNEALLKILDRGLSRVGNEYIYNLSSVYSAQLYTFSFKTLLKENFWTALLVFVFCITLLTVLLIQNIYVARKRIREKETARADIEKANHEKFIFVNKMTNYMREPMNKMVSLVNVSEKSNDLSNIKSNLGEISSYCKEMVTILNNILNMSRFESGQMKIEDQFNLSRFFGKRILVVEDTLPNQDITGKIMKKVGFEVQVAKNGVDALDKIYAAPSNYFNVVLVNVDAAKLGGYELARNIRGIENDVRSEMPILGITASDSEAVKVEIIKSGMNGCITKPYDIVEMLEALSCAIK
jgi:CheY-like chemotaxis protein/ABC-type amino acid transport substrate-binding protein